MISAEDALKLYETVKKYYAIRDSRIDECWKYYAGQYTVSVPQGFEAYIDPKLKGIIDIDSAHIVTSNPVVKVPPTKLTIDAQRKADLKEKFLQMSIQRIRKSNRYDILKRAASHGFKYGEYVIKGPLYDPSVWGDKKTKKAPDGARAYIWPFIIQAINPKRIFPDPHSMQPRFVFEHYKRKVFTVKNNWPDYQTDKLDDEDVDWIEFWDIDVRYYWADGQLVFKAPNLYGYIPYECGFAGLGDESPDGLPEDESIGIIYPSIPTIRARARSLTALDALLQWVAFPALASDKPTAGLNIQFMPGAVNHIPPEMNVRPWFQPQISPDLYKFMAQLDNDLETMTHARAVEGQRSVGVTSAYMQGMLVGEARLRYGELMSNLELSWSNILTKLLMLIENVVDQPITIYGSFGKGQGQSTIAAKDIAGEYYCEVKLSAEDGEMQERKSMLGIKLNQAGGISRRRMMEDYIGIENASEEEDQIDVDRLLAHPMVQQAQAAEVAKQMGYGNIVDQLGINQPGTGAGKPAPASGIPGAPQPSNQRKGLPSLEEMKAELAGMNKEVEGEYGSTNLG